MSFQAPPSGPSNQGASSLPTRPQNGKTGGSGFKPAFKKFGNVLPTSTSAPTAGPSLDAFNAHKAAQPQPSVPVPGAVGFQNRNNQNRQYGAHTGYNAGYNGGGIQNPFPSAVPVGGYDPNMAAQIAQWQSAYSPANPQQGAPGSEQSFAPAAPPPAATSANAQKTGPGSSKKTVVREGGGKKWADDTLMEWDPSHVRIFVGNLAGETTDDSLLKAFSRWKSVQKARVIRDKRTNKSKGYGFVSFSDVDDFFQAAKEMNGKYIQSHPVVIKKATTEVKPTTIKDKKQKNRNNKNKKPGETALGPQGGGIVKPGQKNKDGIRFLG